MSEKKDKSNGIDQDYLAFLTQQAGGADLAQSEYRRHTIRETFKVRSSSTVTMGEILDLIEQKGWMEWLRGTNVVAFFNMFVRPSTTRTPGEHKPRQSEQSKVDALMTELGKTPWISKPDVAKLWNMKAVQGVDKLMNALVEQGKLKKHRGRTVLFAKAEETVPPPA